MNPKDYIKASDGNGEAVRAIVTEDRGIGNMALVVDSVLNWPHKFIATSGTVVDDQIDPETATVFYGHLDGSIIMIDEFAPGYTDNGNTEDQVVVLKPTTPWADAVAEAAEDAFLSEITEAEIDEGASTVKRAITGRMTQYIIDKVNAAAFLWTHPVKSIYMTVDPVNPGTVYGGTWVAWGSGRVPVGIDSGQTEFNTVEKTDGHKELQQHSHTGGTSTNGGHNHGYSIVRKSQLAPYGGYARVAWEGEWEEGRTTSWNGDHSHSFTTDNTGGGNAGNLQPYITCYMWKRTA